MPFGHNRSRCGENEMLLSGVQMTRVLTDREREVLSWLAEGKTSWEISAILGLSERGVNAVVNSASLKLDAVNRLHAVVKAIKAKEIQV